MLLLSHREQEAVKEAFSSERISDDFFKYLLIF